MDDDQQSLSSSSNGDIIPARLSSSGLDPIQVSLCDKLEAAENPEEVQAYLSLIKAREEQIRQKEYLDFQIAESKNQINYDRKLRVYKESVAVVFSIFAIILGIQTINSIPLIAPLIIILGLIKPLGYSIGEVLELYKGLTQPQKSSQGETTKQVIESSKLPKS